MKHRLATLCALTVLPAFIALASLPAQAQTGNAETGSTPDASAGGKKAATPQPKKSAHAANAGSGTDKPLKAGQYATEAAARAHCGGRTVVWVDNDNFHHYAGSREYGRKPGAFACE